MKGKFLFSKLVASVLEQGSGPARQCLCAVSSCAMSAGAELMFFTAACLVLWFRFMPKAVLMTHECFSVSKPSLFVNEQDGSRQEVGRRHLT